MTPCARLHTIPGSHAPGCTCTRECPDHEGHCPGCAPVEATRGLLCGRCSQRLRDNLGASEGLEEAGEEPIHGLPWAYDHLADAYPSLSQAPSGAGGGSGPADQEAQRLAEVLSLRADIHERLLWWTFELMNATDRAGPDIPSTQRLDVRRCAAWLLTQVEQLEVYVNVQDAWEELAELMSRAHALAPWRPAPTHLDGVPCRCGALALHDHGTEVACWSCRRNYSRDEYRILTKVLAHRFAPVPG